MALFGKRVLLIGDEGVVLFSVKGSFVVSECSIPWMVPNFEEQLLEVLTRKNKGKSVLVLFDAVEQHYRKETIANVGSFDRPKVLKRKLAMAFPNYPVRASIALEGEAKRGKKKNKGSKQPPSYLFAALPHSEYLDKVTDVLFEAGVPLAGLALLPVEAAGLLEEISKKIRGKKVEKKERWTVLIGHHETGGIRQVVTKDGDLALTRLTPLAEGEAVGQAWADEVVREFKATLSYIARFGYNADDGIEVIFVCGEEEKAALSAASLPVKSFNCYTLPELAQMLKIKLSPTVKVQYADALHAVWSGKKFKPKMPMKAPGLQKILQPRLFARFATVGLFFGAIALSVLSFNSHQAYLGFQEEIDNKRNQRNIMQREYDQEAEIFDVLPVKPEVVRGAIAVSEMLDVNAIKPKPFMSVIRRVLGEGITIDSFNFSHTPNSDLSMLGSAGGGDARAAMRSRVAPVRGGRRGPTAGMRGPQQEKDRGQVEIVFRFGLPKSMSLEEKVIKAEDLQIQFQNALPDHEIEILEQFGNVSRGGEFKSEITDESTSANALGSSAKGEYAEFSIKGAPL